MYTTRFNIKDKSEEMKDKLHEDANKIIIASIKAVMPDSAVVEGIKNMPEYKGRLIVFSIGKAGWQMAYALSKLNITPDAGLIVTKYGHYGGKIQGYEIIEAGHPIPDENSCLAGKRALEMIENLDRDDLVLALISGGASALFEVPLVPLSEMTNITSQLLGSGADIVEINTIRKRLSAVKGGKFALKCLPARVYSIMLSDVLGDIPDMIASGPTCPDPSDSVRAAEIIDRYKIKLSEQARKLLKNETPKQLPNASYTISGSVSELCLAAAEKCRELGYETIILTDSLSCQAREAGSFLASVARYYAEKKKQLAIIAGGETVVKLTGNGKGGRNQELVLAAAEKIAGLDNVLIFSLGSDGTDGPTDAAGGIVDGKTVGLLEIRGVSVKSVLDNNDSYDALKKCGGLIITGPTGTNVNDISCILIGEPDLR